MSDTNNQRRTPLFREWDSVLQDVESLQRDGYDRLGNWGLGQICNHLAIVMECALDGFPTMLPWPVRKILRFLILGKMLKHKQIGFRAKAAAFAAQNETVDDCEGAARLKVAIARFSEPSAEYVEHLAFGKLNRDQWKHQQLWHCEHHLSFLIPRGGGTSDSQ